MKKRDNILPCDKCDTHFCCEYEQYTHCVNCGILCNECCELRAGHRGRKTCPDCGGPADIFVPKDVSLPD